MDIWWPKLQKEIPHTNKETNKKKKSDEPHFQGGIQGVVAVLEGKSGQPTNRTRKTEKIRTLKFFQKSFSTKIKQNELISHRKKKKKQNLI